MPGVSNWLVREASLWRTAPSWESRAARDSRVSTWVAALLIIGTIGFNAVLCFLNTRGIVITDIRVMMAEVLLIAGTVLACRNYLTSVHVFLLGSIVLYTVVLSVIRYADVPALGFDPKISRDLIIPVVFFLLGVAVGDVRSADRIVAAATAILLLFGLYEYFFLESFLKVLDVAGYYVARGTLEASEWAQDVSQGLMVSGMRPADQGRTLLPFLGDHRVSSLFLEPTTLGNFGTLVAMWAAMRSRMEGRLYLWSALGGVALIILSDTRFDAYFLVIALTLLFIPHRLTTPAILALPFLTVAALYLLAASAERYHGIPMVEGRGVYERLLYSGRVLHAFDVYNWFGVEVSRAQTFDSGYGYVLSNIGIIGFTMLWVMFISLKGSSRYFYAFRNMVGLYFVTLLCISSSVFTIKLAAMLWFLLGTLSLAKDQVLAKSSARRIARHESRRADLLWQGS